MTAKRAKTIRFTSLIDIKAILWLVISVIAISAFGTSAAFATDYHKGWIWDETHHPEEFQDGSVPVYFDTNDLSSNLELATGTTINQIYTQIENAVDAWDDETDFDVHRNDTSTYYHDNRIGSTDLGPNVLGTAYTMRHGFFWDDHIVKVTIDFNDDGNDFQWDHDGDSSTTTPPTIRIYNVALHELGHLNGLCDTYPPGGTQGDCHGHTTTASVMYAYTYGVIETITSNDETEVNREY